MGCATLASHLPLPCHIDLYRDAVPRLFISRKPAGSLPLPGLGADFRVEIGRLWHGRRRLARSSVRGSPSAGWPPPRTRTTWSSSAEVSSSLAVAGIASLSLSSRGRCELWRSRSDGRCSAAEPRGSDPQSKCMLTRLVSVLVSPAPIDRRRPRSLQQPQPGLPHRPLQTRSRLSGRPCQSTAAISACVSLSALPVE